MAELDMSPEVLLAKAQEKAGLGDFGADDFREGLGKLLETYSSTGWDEQSQKRLRRRLGDLLVVRLKIEAAFKRHPEIHDEVITQPVYLTGLPRTGTSALLNLLANDPAHRPMKLWEGLNPDPIEGLPKGAEDPRYKAMKQWEEETLRANKDFDKIHHTSIDTPEECIHLLNHTFADVQFGIETMMEPYASWFQQQDHRPSYHYYKELLKMLQWQRPGDRWLLKSPAHLWALDIIVEMFPDACLIITHRNPLEAVTSYASMMHAMMKGRNYDQKTLGPVVLEYLARKVESSLKQREQLDAARILDIQFNDFVGDPLATVNTIYEHFKLPMTAAAKQRIEAYAAEHPMGKHGKHEYDFDEFGLSEQMILDRFGFYIERFNVPMN